MVVTVGFDDPVGDEAEDDARDGGAVDATGDVEVVGLGATLGDPQAATSTEAAMRSDWIPWRRVMRDN